MMPARRQKTSLLQVATSPSARVSTDRKIADQSTLTLLEHVNLNVPSHQYILPFYFDILKCGMDPRKVENLQPNAPKKTLWANCGASQFHLPYGDKAQRIPGQIGLYYESLEGLKGRLEALTKNNNDDDEDSSACVKEWEVSTANGREVIRLVDRYDNVFLCRVDTLLGRRAQDWKQPLVPTNDETYPQEVRERFGRDDGTECRGLDYVEFECPVGTAEKIALFYESVFDATASVVQEDGSTQKIAVIAFGNIDTQGRADQSLLFRENTNAVPAYDGHHIAMYVGESVADFERAFAHAQTAGVVWVNPRFSDKAQDLEGARQWRQFRFKNIIDMETGATVFELEHEMRSIEHESWPGPVRTE